MFRAHVERGSFEKRRQGQRITLQTSYYFAWFSDANQISQDNERIAVYIRGAQCVNRAVDGDIVAFELLPEAEWFSQDGMPAEPAKEEVRITKHVV